MLKIITQVRDKRSLYSQEPNDRHKKLWSYIADFFKHNNLTPTSLNFKDKTDNKTKDWKAGHPNFRKAIKLTKVIQISNETDHTRNKRFLEVRICECETRFKCKCGDDCGA